MPPKGMTRLNINIESQLHARFKAACALAQQEMTDVLIACIEAYVNQHLPAKPGKKGGRQ